MIITILIIVWIVLLLESGILFSRNEKTYALCMKMLNDASELSRKEINSYIFDKWENRFELLKKVSYYKMIHMFWLPLKPESFYTKEELLLFGDKK